MSFHWKAFYRQVVCRIENLMDSFLLSVPDSGHRNHFHVAVVGNCLQEVSPLCLALLDFSAVRKQPLLFIVWALREEEEAGRCHGDTERGEVSVQECAWASLGSTRPRWLGGNPWQGEAGKPRSPPSALSLHITAPLPLLCRLAASFSRSVIVSRLQPGWPA